MTNHREMLVNSGLAISPFDTDQNIEDYFSLFRREIAYGNSIEKTTQYLQAFINKRFIVPKPEFIPLNRCQKRASKKKKFNLN